MRIVALMFLAVFFLEVFLSESVSSQVPATPAVSVPAAVTPMIITPALPGSVQVAAPAAPPAWAQELIVTIEALPIIGPVVSKILLYGGILAALLTSLVAFLLGVSSILKGGFSSAGLTSISTAIAAFQQSKFMYWLTYFSNFNVKPPKT